MPDDRDWVRMQHERCDECGYDASSVPESALAAAVRRVGERWAQELPREPAADLRARAQAEVWSALEYACHTRDVFGVFAPRVERALHELRPEFGWWDHEAAARLEGYNEQDPGVVVAELQANAERLAAVVDSVPAEGWQRVGTRRASEEFTVVGLVRFALHEGHHHLQDATTARQRAR